MSKNGKRENETPQAEQTPDAAQLISKTPIMDEIVSWLLPLIPKAQHEAIKAQAAKLAGEQDGFVRNGNRIDYNRDEEAFASAGIEHTNDGPVLVYSNMAKRRAHDIIRTGLFYLSEAIYQPTPQKNLNPDGTPKMNHRKGEREKWLTSLGFAKVEVGSGMRYVLKVPGSEALIAKVEQLVPERFDGTAKPENPKKSVGFLLPAIQGARTVSLPLYDPESAKVDAEKFTIDLSWVRIQLSDHGWSFKEPDARVPSLYLAALAAENTTAQAPAQAAA